jgi:hypothetical protein
MRSALAGTANKVVALKTTAAVPMSVIERMVHLLCGVATTMHGHTQFLESNIWLRKHFLGSLRNILKANAKWSDTVKQTVYGHRGSLRQQMRFPWKRGGKAMSRKQSSRKEKSATNMQNKNESNLGQKEARIEKEKTSELAHMGEKSAQSEKSD